MARSNYKNVLLHVHVHGATIIVQLWVLTP